MLEIADGLVRWEASHPDWHHADDADSPAFWPRMVGCVAVRGERHTVFVDPLSPASDAEWATLDALAAGRECATVTTIPWHVRDRDAFAERYGARILRYDEPWPAGLEPLVVAPACETLVWLPAHATLIPGDLLLGDDHGGLRMCPQSWLDLDPVKQAAGERPPTVAELQAMLRELIPRPVQRVLVSHWEPVLDDADAALDRALSAA